MSDALRMIGWLALASAGVLAATVAGAGAAWIGWRHLGLSRVRLARSTRWRLTRRERRRLRGWR